MGFLGLAHLVWRFLLIGLETGLSGAVYTLAMKSNRKTKTNTNRGSGAGRGSRRSKTSESRAGQKSATPTKLRIIGGKHRGRLIDYHGADFTRPMKDNIRENLFNILGPSIRGRLAFDLFAGTGALGFEALSRGAESAVIVEQNRQAVRFIEKTTTVLELESQVRVIHGDAFLAGAAQLSPPDDDKPWVVFLCPPYALWDSALPELKGLISRFWEHAPIGSVLVAETEKSFDPEALPTGNWDFRIYGNTRLGFIESEPRCGLSL